MKKLLNLLFISFFLFMTGALSAQSESEWISLFNGKNMNGWFAYGGADWSVQDGVIVGETARGHLYTYPTASDFEAKGVFRISGHTVIGLYDDYELKVATFFHEIGHTLISENFEKLVNYDNLLIEYEAWIRGLKEAKKHDIHFTGKTFKYILKSLDTYYEEAVRSYTKRSSKWHRKNL